MTGESKAAIELEARKELDSIVNGIASQVELSSQILRENITKTNSAAQQMIAKAGELELNPSEQVNWTAINPFNKQSTDIKLPQMLIGNKWLGQVSNPNDKVPLVDELTAYTGAKVTLFQKMNSEGDMLRIATSVLTEKGTRAIGTYIPASDTTGKKNPIITQIINGKSFSGRAWVVDQWYETFYSPLKDKKGELVGMIFTGVPESMVNTSLKERIQSIKIGKSGYPYVLNAKGEDKGRYVVSFQGKRNGEMILDMKDSSGRAFIKEIVEKAISLQPGEKEMIRYPWLNQGESKPRWKQVRYLYYEPYDWVIAAGTYEEELYEMVTKVEKASDEMIRLILIVSMTDLVIAGLGAV